MHDFFGDCTLTRIHHALYGALRELEGKSARPTTSIVDSQSEKRRRKRRLSHVASGYDGAKKLKGTKRHIAVDTLGPMHGLVLTPAHVQDRDMIAPMMGVVRRVCSTIERCIADGGYQGAATACRHPARDRQAIRCRNVVLPKRKIVERTFGWLGMCRRFAKDFENHMRTHAAFVILAMIRLILRRITRYSAHS